MSTDDAARAARLERLTVDIDTRIADLWALAWSGVLARTLDDEEVAGAVGAMVRAAYGLGYRDALQEDKEGRRDELARANGYATERTYG